MPVFETLKVESAAKKGYGASRTAEFSHRPAERLREAGFRINEHLLETIKEKGEGRSPVQRLGGRFDEISERGIWTRRGVLEELKKVFDDLRIRWAYPEKIKSGKTDGLLRKGLFGYREAFLPEDSGAVPFSPRQRAAFYPDRAGPAVRVIAAKGALDALLSKYSIGSIDIKLKIRDSRQELSYRWSYAAKEDFSAVGTGIRITLDESKIAHIESLEPLSSIYMSATAVPAKDIRTGEPERGDRESLVLNAASVLTESLLMLFMEEEQKALEGREKQWERIAARKAEEMQEEKLLEEKKARRKRDEVKHLEMLWLEKIYAKRLYEELLSDLRVIIGGSEGYLLENSFFGGDTVVIENLLNMKRGAAYHAVLASAA